MNSVSWFIVALVSWVMLPIIATGTLAPMFWHAHDVWLSIAGAFAHV